MKYFKMISIATLFVAMTSCSSYFGPGNFASESTPYQKPTYRGGDTFTKAKYISGGIYKTTGVAASAFFKSIQFADVSFNKSYTNKNAIYAFGGFVHAGTFELENFNDKINRDISKDFTSPTKGDDFREFNRQTAFFTGAGVSGEMALNIPIENVDLRIIGIKLTLMYEDGDYADLRKDIVKESRSTLIGESIVDLAPNKISINLSQTTEVIYKMPKADLGFWFTTGTGSQLLTASVGSYFSKNRWTGKIHFNTAITQGVFLGAGFSYQLK